MARRLKPKNENNPLRQLRGIIASQGRTHISQEELARICLISANTIRKIEFGSRPLSRYVLTKVAISTGAWWNHERRRWTRYDKAPFTYADFCEHRRKMLDPSTLNQAIKMGLVIQIHSRIEWLFQNVPAKTWDILRILVDDSLEECKRRLKLTKNDALFYRPWASSAKDSAYAQFTNLAQQKLEQTADKRSDFRGDIAGDKKKKRKYGP